MTLSCSFGLPFRYGVLCLLSLLLEVSDGQLLRFGIRAGGNIFKYADGSCLVTSDEEPFCSVSTVEGMYIVQL